MRITVTSNIHYDGDGETVALGPLRIITCSFSNLKTTQYEDLISEM